MTQAFAGVIKCFDVQKGWGHISCEQTQQLYGKDVFLLRSQLNGMVPAKGDEVYFDVTEGQKGVEASNVMVVSNSPTSGEGVYMGEIKSWNPEKGWGHIQCEQTHYLYEKDIFVMRSALPGGHCQPGDRVSFTVKDGDKGPEAATVTVLKTRSVPVPRASPQGQQPAFWGSIKNFDEEKGWGHIICDQTRQLYGKDMFVMRSSLNGQTVNAEDNVRFSVAMGIKGPEARDVVLMGQRGHMVPPPQVQTGPWGEMQPESYGVQIAAKNWDSWGQRYSGVVKNWNEEKGWGFVSCQETMNTYGKDIFLHKKELYGQAPLAGSLVQFSVSFGEDGRPIATTVALSSGGSQPIQRGAGAVVPPMYPRATPY